MDNNNPVSQPVAPPPTPVAPPPPATPPPVSQPPSQATITPSFSIGEAIKIGWSLMLKNIGFYILVTLMLLGVASLVIMLVLAGSFINLKPRGEISAFILNIIYNIFQLNLVLGYIKVSIDLVDGKRPSFSELFKQYPRLIKLIASTILYTIAVLVGAVFFIIPGIIIAMRLSFYIHLIVDGGLDPIGALKKSWEITKGHTIKLILLSFLSVLIYAAGYLVLIVGAIFTAQIVFIAYAWIYRQLLNSSQVSSQSQNLPESHPATS